MAYDLILIGGGHNGLTTAALAARSGRRVLVLEKREVVGGLAAGLEFHPGYRSPGVLHETARVRPSVVDALDLAAHGLRRRERPLPVFAPQRDGDGLLLTGDVGADLAEIRAHSNLDADQYEEFVGFEARIRDYVRGVMTEPPPRLIARGFGQYLELFKKGLALRKLGRATMYECLRVAPMSVEDWLGEWFENDLLKASLCAPGLLGTWTSPRAAGTAALAMIERSTATTDVIGGPAALTRALSAACQAAGVEVRTGVDVRRIVVERGRATGVELADGTREEARSIASSVDPRRTFLDLVRPIDLPAGLEWFANWRMRGTTAKVDLALSAPLAFAGRDGELFEHVRVSESMTEIERAFDGVKYGELPERPHLDVRIPTLSDPRLAPDNHHVASILVHFVPYDLASGWTDARKNELLDAVLVRLSEVAPACRDHIVAHAVLSPADIEREFGVTGGHVHHGEHGLDQMLSLRPHPTCARFATPIEGLYLCGSGSHPGGGITCGPGELAAAALP